MPIDFTCPYCGRQTNVPEVYAGRSGPCAGCGRTITVPPPQHPFTPAGPKNLADDAGVRMLLPVGRSGWAIAAGYAGLFAVLILPAPLALLLGIVAIRDIKRHPDKHGMGRAVFGLVMGALFTSALVLPLVVFLVQCLVGRM